MNSLKKFIPLLKLNKNLNLFNKLPKISSNFSIIHNNYNYNDNCKDKMEKKIINEKFLKEDEKIFKIITESLKESDELLIKELLKENEEILKENEEILKENEEVLKENEEVLKRNDIYIKSFDRINSLNKISTTLNIFTIIILYFRQIN